MNFTIMKNKLKKCFFDKPVFTKLDDDRCNLDNEKQMNSRDDCRKSWGQFVILDQEYLTYFSNYKYNKIYKYNSIQNNLDRSVFTKSECALSRRSFKPTTSYKDLNMLQIIYETQFEFDEDNNCPEYFISSPYSTHPTVAFGYGSLQTISFSPSHLLKTPEEELKQIEEEELKQIEEEELKQMEEEELNQDEKKIKHNNINNISGCILIMGAIAISVYIII